MAKVCVVRCHSCQDSRLQREVEALAGSGYEVDVVCLRGSGDATLDAAARVHRLPFEHAAGAPAWRLLLEYAAFFFIATVLVTTMHVRRRFDVVQVNSVPDALVFVALLPRLLGARVLLDLQEPMPEFFQTRFGKSSQHLLVRLIALVEQLSMRFADRVITVTEPMRRIFIERGAVPEKISVVMDGADESVFDPTRFKTSRGGSRYILLSHGSIEPQYGLDTAIEAVAKLRGKIPELRLQVFGQGSQLGELQRLTQHLDVGELVSFSERFIPIDELVRAISAADLGVVAMKRDDFRDLTLAGKMFDFIAMGVPMVVSETQSTKEVFGDGCFEYFTADDPSDLARAIHRVYQDRALGRSYAARAAEVVAPFKWSVQRERYRGVVESLLTP